MHFTTPYLHRSNPVERANRTVLDMIKTTCQYLDDQRTVSWLDKISRTQLILDNTIKSGINLTPMQIVHRNGVMHGSPEGIFRKKGLTKYHEEIEADRIKLFNKRVQAMARVNRKVKDDYMDRVKVGSLVLYFSGVQKGKLSCPASGPYVVLEFESPYVWLQSIYNASERLKTTIQMVKVVQEVTVGSNSGITKSVNTSALKTSLTDRDSNLEGMLTNENFVMFGFIKKIKLEPQVVTVSTNQREQINLFKGKGIKGVKGISATPK